VHELGKERAGYWGQGRTALDAGDLGEGGEGRGVGGWVLELLSKFRGWGWGGLDGA
jgi:hypothetical protein